MSVLSVQPTFPIFTEADGQPLENGYIWIGTANLDPQVNPIAVYWDAALTQPAVQPIRTINGYPAKSGSPGRLYVNSDYSIRVQNKNGSVIYSAPASTDKYSSELITFLQAGTGAVATTVQAKLRESYDAINDFGADNTGATNTTAALLAFYNACIATGKSGRIRAGTYKVTPGVLVFDCNFTDKVWPEIFTDGQIATIFQIDSATETDAPVLGWTNGTATSASGKYWRGGCHGGLTIKGSGTATPYTNQHHISLTGTWGLRFGWMRSDNCKGNSIHLPQNLYGGTNPDPYANSFTYFEAIESNYAAGWAVKNDNFLGMDSWLVDNVRIIQPTAGGWFGIGSGNVINNWSVGNCQGWVFDDGTYSAATGGAPQRNYIQICEFDNCKYGIRLNRSGRTKFIGVRFVARYQTAPNTTAAVWPLTCVDLAGGTTPNVYSIDLDALYDLRSGTLGTLGTYLSCNNNGNITNVSVTSDYADNASAGLTDANLAATNLASSAVLWNTRRTKTLDDQRDKALSSARGSASTTIVSSGLGTAPSKVAFPTQQWSVYSTFYSTSDYTFTAPSRGLYLLQASIALTVAVGTRVRICFVRSASGICGTTYSYQVNAGSQVHKTSIMAPMAAGETVYVSADQNTAGTVNCTPTTSNDEVSFTVAQL